MCEYRCGRPARGVVYDDRGRAVRTCRRCAGPDGFDAVLT